MNLRRLPDAWKGVGIALVYFLVAKFGLSLAFGTAQVTTVWPPAGIALATMLLLGYRYWPGIIAGAFFANVTTSEPVWVALLIALGNTLEALAGAAWLRRVQFQSAFSRIRDVWIFIGVALSVVLLASLIGVTSLALGHEISWPAFQATFRVWYLGDLMGILLMAPVILLWKNFKRVNPFQKKYYRTIALSATVLVTQILTYLRSYQPSELLTPRAYQAFPLVIWAAIQTSPFGVALTTFFISMIAILGTVHGQGPFSQQGSVEANLISLQSFLFYVVATGMTLAAVVAERHSLNDAVLDKAQELKFLNQDLADALRQGQSEKRQLKATVGQLEKTKEAMLNLLEDLDEGKSRVEAMVMAVGEGLVVFDKYTKVVLVNQAFEHMTGWTAEQALGRPINEVLPATNEQGQSIPSEQRPYQKVLTGGKTVTTRLDTEPFWYVAKDGHRFPAAVTVTPMIFSGKIAGGVNVFRDITHEQDIDRAKTEFVSLASHELRTPLTIVRWSIDMLKKYTGPLSEHQKKYILAIEQTGREMVDLVDALLNVSRIEMGTLMIEPVPTKLHELIDKIVFELSPMIAGNQVRLTTSVPASLPAVILDPQLIRVVIINLLTNALKYTPPKGKIKVTGRREDDWVVIEVADTGYGIPAAAQDKIFTKLFRADNIKIRQARGTGLGLYITKAVIERSGGSIWFTSKENKGSTFSFKLPIGGVPARAGTKTLTAG